MAASGVSRRLVLVALTALAACGAPPADAPDAPPTRDALLTLSGAIGRPNRADGTFVIDRDLVDALPWREIETTTPFTDGVQTFGGVSAADLFDMADPGGATLVVHAADDYTVSAPLRTLRDHDALFAVERNGAPLAGTAYGPVWIVYDFDSLEADKAERLSRLLSPWAATRAEIVE